MTGNDSSATGVPGVDGFLRVKTARHAKDKQSTLVPGTSLVRVPLYVGRKATFTETEFTVLGVLHYVTVDFYAWTPHTITFSGLTSKGMPGQPGDMATKVVAKGSFGLTAMGGGTVTLVSPSKITIEGCIPNECAPGLGISDRKSASFMSLKLTYAVPEPATLLLLGAGVAGLVLVGVRKRS